MTSGEGWGYGRPPEYEPYSPPPPSAPPPATTPSGTAPTGTTPPGMPPGGSQYPPPYPPPDAPYAPSAPSAPSAMPYTGPVSTRSSVGVIGLALAVVGAVLGVVAFTALDWFDGDTRSHFADVRQVLKLLHLIGADNAIAYNYFNWLAWFLLGAAVVTAVLANIETPAVVAFRVMGAVIGAAGIVVTFLAIDLISKDNRLELASGAPRGYGDYLKHSRVAFYFALAAFLATMIASLIGRPRPGPR